MRISSIRSLLFWFALSVLTDATSQPVITWDDHPEPGYVVSFHERWTYSGLMQLLLNTSGPSAVWDLFQTINDTMGTTMLIEPGLAPGGMTFLDATAAEQGFDHDAVRFDSLATDANYLLGVFHPVDSVRILDQPMRSLLYPCQFGIAWQDSATWSEPLTGHSGIRVIHDTVDGYGELHLPWGYAYDLLSIRESETWFTIAGPDTSRLEIRRRRFLKPGFPVDVASAFTALSFASGDSLGTYVCSRARFLDELSFTSIQELEPGNDTGPWIYPDPVNDVLHVISNGVPSTLEIFDGSGRLVLKREKEQDLIVSSLETGAYLLRIANGRENRTLRFSKQ